MQLKLGRNTNGNKTILVKFKGTRGFSIRTMGNLHLSHRMSKDDFDYDVVRAEVSEYIESYGTLTQKKLLRKL